MLTPLHQAIKQALKKAPLIHADETSHHRNDEQSLRWCWLVASDDLVYEQILYSRSTSSAKKSLMKTTQVLWSATNAQAITG
ncbi:IS66 family transposase [Vibrio metschnikovii]|uniref:IS66 family transposase n=1 Tax=Vibrio metschnikovii TaxID=28172 RepID=UPI00315DB47D